MIPALGRQSQKDFWHWLVFQSSWIDDPLAQWNTLSPAMWKMTKGDSYRLWFLVSSCMHTHQENGYLLVVFFGQGTKHISKSRLIRQLDFKGIYGLGCSLSLVKMVGTTSDCLVPWWLNLGLPLKPHKTCPFLLFNSLCLLYSSSRLLTMLCSYQAFRCHTTTTTTTHLLKNYSFET